MANFPFITDVGFTADTIGAVLTGYVYDFDSILPDGITTIFQLQFDLEPVLVTDPNQILVYINGAIQPTFKIDNNYTWGLGLPSMISARKGYTISSPGYIRFAQPPALASQIVIKPIIGNVISRQKNTPFRPLDIAMGP